MVQKMGHYEIVEELGRGGMGVVYKGFDPTLGRHVAIKVLSDQMSDDAAVVARFQHEARSVAALNHPHIIQIYFIGESNGQHFFVMEYVEGESLGSYIRRNHPLVMDDALRILHETAAGLAAAHKIGVIHRDIKPANIMIDGAGKVKIADFGIALTLDMQKKLTATGQFLGTPGYLSPEVCLGEKADGRTDIFSLGIVFFEMLTGEVPFHADSPLAMLSKVVNEAVPDVRQFNGTVPQEVQGILAKMVEKSPANRFQSCEALMAAIDAHRSQQKTQSGTAYDAFTAPTEAIARPPGPPPAPPKPPPAPAAAPMPPTRAMADAVRPAPPPQPAKSRGLLVAVLLLFGLAVLGGGGYFAWQQFGPASSKAEPETTVAELDTQQPPQLGIGETPTNDALADEPTSLGVNDSASSEGSADPDEEGMDPRSHSNSLSPGFDPEAGSDQNADPVPGIQAEAVQFDAESQPSKRAAHPGETKQVHPQVQEPETKTTLNTSSVNTRKAQPTETAPSAIVTKRETTTPTVKAKKTVVVAVHGDVWLTDPVSQTLLNSLQGHAFQVKDASMLNGADSLLGEKSANLAGFSQLVNSQGGDVLVLAELIYLSERQLQYMGRQTTAYKSRLKLRAIRTNDRAMVGNGWQTDFEYTQINATAKAEEACRKINQEMVDAVVNALGK